ncbi:DUF4184 family protein [Dactylosporangium sp. NPDC048998]|uniref:DUF4184 family protein n=1 Tax=Dactylosporangium sp. NPDC048998 TaxID=3363976 RepID=UPI00371DF51C
MPFTLSHPAVVLPLSRGPLVASALVIGSVAPDLPYVLPQATSADWGWYSNYNLTYTHELGTGILCGTITALLLVALFHHLLKRPLIALLPPAAAARLAGAAERFRWSGPQRFAWVAASAAMGVLTHLAWDALVHENGSAWWSLLPDTRNVTEGLWWVSTLAGAVALAVWLCRWWRRTPRGWSGSLRPAVRWTALAALAVAGVIGAVFQVVKHGDNLIDALRSVAVLRGAVGGAMSGFGAAMLLYAVLWRIRSRSTSAPAA